MRGIAFGKLHRGSTKCFPLERAAEAKGAAWETQRRGMQFAGREIRLLITSKAVYNPSSPTRITA
jgi:hypothetical protein